MKSLFYLLHIICALLTCNLVFSSSASASKINNIDLSNTEFAASSTSQQLDYIAWLSPQYPSRTQELIASLEQRTNTLSDSDSLRLLLLSCLNYIDLGRSNTALKIAKQGAEKTRQLRIDHARPYFLYCEANAYDYLGDQTQHILANEEAIKLAKQYLQPQALLAGLAIKTMQAIQHEDFAVASEHLQLALSLYPSAEEQIQSWYLLPEVNLKLIMSNMLFSSGDYSTALSLAKEAQKSPQANGELAVVIKFYLIRLSLALGDMTNAEQYFNALKERSHVTQNAFALANFNAQTAFIELHFGNLTSAERLILKTIDYLVENKDSLRLMRAQRTLAMIYFAQNRDTDALTLMSKIITKATQYEQYYDLIDFHQILSDYYQKQGDFQQAFYQQTYKFTASQQAHAKLSNTHIAQLKADRESINNIIAYSDTDASSLSFKAQNIALLSLSIFILLASFVFFIYRKPATKTPITQEDNQQQQAELILSNAKQGNYPLSLLLLDISAIREVDVAIMISKLQKALREQDYIVRKNIDEIIILLPYTSEKGAQRVAKQLEPQVQAFQGPVVNFGVANLQQLDSVDTLVKRASLNLLSQIQKHNQHITQFYNEE